MELCKAVGKLENQPRIPSSRRYFDLGEYACHWITTNNDNARTWFNRGLNLLYGFNHLEAYACFKQATTYDEKCAIAYWGQSYTLGPNYNMTWEDFDPEELPGVLKETFRLKELANEHAKIATEPEKALIKTLDSRYPDQSPPKDRDFKGWICGYYRSMKDVYKSHKDNLDIAVLFMESLINIHPWKLWNLDNGKPECHTIEAKAVFDDAMRCNREAARKHPGLLHIYIHLMEMSPEAGDTMKEVEPLQHLVPDAGHLLHMMSHINVARGEYVQAIDWNGKALDADNRYFDAKFAIAAKANYVYVLYRCHNYHFRIYSAMFAGKFKLSLAMAEEMKKSIEPVVHKFPALADPFLAMDIHVLIRFGRWDDIINMPSPTDASHPVTTATVYYGKAIAYAAKGQIENAEAEQKKFCAAVEQVPETITLHRTNCKRAFKIASAVLDGELEYRKASVKKAFEHLRESIKRYDELTYDEPWGWMHPPRHVYGAFLIEQGCFEEAKKEYENDLGINTTLSLQKQHRNNIWALSGYHKCLESLHEKEEAKSMEQKLRELARTADVIIESSCFCALGDRKCTVSGQEPKCCQ